MDFSRESVALDRIDSAERRYHITRRGGCDDLKASIAAVGLLQPPFLMPGGARCAIVAGFRRVAACRDLGWREIPARVLPSGSDGLTAARVAVADNAGQRPLDLLECARAVALLARHVDGPSALALEAGGLGLAGNREMISKLLTLSRLPRAIQAAVGDATLTLPMALEVGRHPEETAGALTGLFSRLKPSLNRQREFLELLREISLREGVGIADILREPEPGSILGDPAADRNRTSRLLRDYLVRRRFPHIARAEADVARAIEALGLGADVSLSPPRHFEGGAFTLALSFRDRRGLERQRDTLDAMLRHPALERILEGPAAG